jgi:predicted acetyltransferase
MHLERASETPPPGLAEFLRELGDGEGGFGGTSFGRHETNLAGFLRACLDGEDAAKLRPGLVPQTVYWMIDDNSDAVIGMVRVRHYLNDVLLRSGGHIGYYVRPAARGRGHATRALRLALDALRDRGVTRVLVTVAPDNAASIRVALANGGEFDGQGPKPETGEVLNRYWIDL